MKNLSVVIPNLHSPLIVEVVDALRLQTARDSIVEIIVVGMDRYRRVANDALVRLIPTERPTPAGTARNIGAATARGELLLFLDADCVLAPNAIERLLVAYAQGYDALIGGVALETGHYWELCNNLMTFPHNTTLDTAGERPTLASFCMLMSQQLWERTGGFDAALTVACEDMDLSLRMRRAGYRLGFEPTAVVRHRPSRTNIHACYQNHRAYGWYWRHIRSLYADMFPPSPGLHATANLGNLGAAASVPLAFAFAARLILTRRPMWRYWYTLPGLILLRLAWYDGFRQSARFAAQQPRRA